MLVQKEKKKKRRSRVSMATGGSCQDCICVCVLVFESHTNGFNICIIPFVLLHYILTSLSPLLSCQGEDGFPGFKGDMGIKGDRVRLLCF